MTMERLTFEGNFCDIAQCAETQGDRFCESGACSQRKIWERLKAYETTERTPEEIDMDHEAAEELRRLCQYCDLDRLEELAVADKDGRVVVVRCKDCEHYDMGVCLKIYSDGNVHPEAWQERKPEDFCSYGEPKDEYHADDHD